MNIYCFFVILLINIPFLSKAQVVHISEQFFNLDMDKKMILVNEHPETINLNYPEPKSIITSGGRDYQLVTTVPQIATNISYMVADNQNDTFALFFTTLPVVQIQTNNTIVDEPRVYANFTLCESNGALVQQDIGIEYRGGSTQVLPKKSLRIEFWEDALGEETKNISLLGMRRDDDWNLEALYHEPLRLRSKLNFDLWRRLDTLYYQAEEPEAINGVHHEFIELFVNNEYRGVYGLSERVDRKQLKIKKTGSNEIRGELYKGVAWGASTFTSLSAFNNNSKFWDGFKYIYPSDTIDWSSMYNFVDFVINENSADFFENFSGEFEVDNAVNYFIFINLLRAYDNVGKNTFIARYDQNAPYFYVPWDLNGALGLFWNGNADPSVEGILSNGIFDRMVNDNSSGGFLKKLELRWCELRTNIITVEHIMEPYYTEFDYLNSNGVYGREAMAWEEYDFAGDQSINYIENWLAGRIAYLDDFFSNTALLMSVTTPSVEDKNVSIFPNPAYGQIRIISKIDDCPVKEIVLFSAVGEYMRNMELLQEELTIDLSNLLPGIYFLNLEFCNGSKMVKRLVIR